jgi:hypothetical protein
MLDDEPRLFFMHFWANDDAKKLALGLKAALAQINIARLADVLGYPALRVADEVGYHIGRVASNASRDFGGAGSMISPSPSLRMIASSLGSSNARGIRTAWFRPFLKSLTCRSETIGIPNCIGLSMCKDVAPVDRVQAADRVSGPADFRALVTGCALPRIAAIFASRRDQAARP